MVDDTIFSMRPGKAICKRIKIYAGITSMIVPSLVGASLLSMPCKNRRKGMTGREKNTAWFAAHTAGFGLSVSNPGRKSGSPGARHHAWLPQNFLLSTQA